MAKYRKRPVVIEAEQFTGEREQLERLDIDGRWNSEEDYYAGKLACAGVIPTLEGQMIASLGDWIITGVNGERYPCKPDIFDKTYEPVAGFATSA